MSQLTMKDLYGCMTALVTPMHDDGTINYKQWQKLLKWQIDSGIQAVIVAGTTGESAVLTQLEFKKLLKITIETCKNTKTKVIAQTGTIAVETVITNNEIAHDLGAHAVLIVTPYYLRTTQEGLYQHFATISKKSKLPIILYNVPSRTQNDLLPETTAKLARLDNIIGIKEASTDEFRINNLVQLVNNNCAVLSGNDDTFFHAMTQGASGVISVASNIRPKTISKICNLYALGDEISAKNTNSSLSNLYKMLSYQPNPIMVKYLLHQAGLIDTGIRLPLIWFKERNFDAKEQIHIIKEEYKNT